MSVKIIGGFLQTKVYLKIYIIYYFLFNHIKVIEGKLNWKILER